MSSAPARTTADPVDVESLAIVPHPHPVLAMKASPVMRVDDDLVRVINRMWELMYESEGVGLAAPQIGIPLRIFVANPSGDRDEGPEMVMINPEIQRPKGNDSMEEGCLSLPEIRGEVKRPKKVSVTAYNAAGQLMEITTEGFVARVLQHENDHLDGTLFYQRMTGDARVELDDSIEQLESDFRRRQAKGEIASDDALVQDARSWLARYA